MPSIIDRIGSFLNRGRTFIGSKTASLGNRVRGGVYQMGDRIFGGGVGTGKSIFTSAANHMVDQALNGANYYAKKFANTDFIRRNAGMVVPELENAADYFTKKLRNGYYGYGADSKNQSIDPNEAHQIDTSANWPDADGIMK